MINGNFILQLHVKGLSGSFGVWVPDQSTKVFKRTTEFCLDSKENTGQLCLKNIWRLSKPESRSKPPLKGPGKMPMTDQEGAQSISKHGHKNILGSNFFFFFPRKERSEAVWGKESEGDARLFCSLGFDSLVLAAKLSAVAEAVTGIAAAGEGGCSHQFLGVA